ncbi:right-handed parallel beta-helix repeat-containing protein [Aestuariivivens sp. NBU2969]|uniref:right-handed parallel beta-helix repeat-containing protein n=1 Tax=Aestuariivivens sp. NBU2969 TaxID=2873267 RepID=UPI001CC1C1CB|nr:right-handed parallel beta-helix repeat-containing protein [Aestuariivivens sp. NBU2969]
MNMLKALLFFVLTFFVINAKVFAKEYYVSVKGNDNNTGSASAPFRTISEAVKHLFPGDTVTVHEGVYREWVNPVRGGKSDLKRIVFRAAPGEKVEIKGSEVINGWEKVEGHVWKVVIPNSFFGSYNPYSDLLTGDWLNNKGINHHTGEVFLNGKSLFEKSKLEDVIESKPYSDALDKEASKYTWYCEVDDLNTTIWANFQKFNPNKEKIEINVRKSCFYSSRPGINYITVRGFIMSQAATQWAAPTAEQIGLIGTHWSKGWIIENNIISNSKAVGITLGKDRSTGQNVWMNNPEKDGSTHYNEVIFRALEAGWSKEKIGSHIVRNNVIFNCEQAGIVGSLGAVYSKIYNNHIYDIWTKRAFSGAEMAGIKIHASIDMLIMNNWIHNTGRGIWLDWMAQGVRVTSNLFYDNTKDDLFAEVNHGPYLVDNNIFLSKTSLTDWSEGGAFAHNLFAGQIAILKVLDRFTPYHFPHSTKVAGLRNINGGDNRFLNNVFVSQDGLSVYKNAGFPSISEGNIYYNGAKPYEKEINAIEISDRNPSFKIEENEGDVYLITELGDSILKVNTLMVTTRRLGIPIISESIYENRDGTSLTIDTDYFGNERSSTNNKIGPFNNLSPGKIKLKVWKQ